MHIAFTEVFLSSLGKEKSCQSPISTLRYSPMKFLVSTLLERKNFYFILLGSVFERIVSYTDNRQISKKKADFYSCV